MKKPLAHYKCNSCHAEWQDYPGSTECPNCGHLYVKWLNYELFDLTKKDKE